MQFYPRQSVKVTNEKLARHGEAGIVETIKGKKVRVRFDTPDPEGELVEFDAGDLAALPGQ